MTQATRRSRAGSTAFASLQVRAYRRYIYAQILSQNAAWLFRVALTWLALEASDGSGVAVGAVTAAQYLPMALLPLAGGWIGDRFDRVRLLVGSQVAGAAVAALLALLAAGDRVSVVVLVIAALSFGIPSALDTPVRLAFVGELVDTALLRNATSLSSAAFNLGRLVGPAIAGVLLSTVADWTIFAIVAALLSAGALVLAGIERRPAPPAAAGAPVRWREVVALVRSDADLALPITLGLVLGATATNLQLAVAFVTTDVFGRGASGYGVALTALGLGSVIGSVASAGRDRRPLRREIAVLGVAFGLLHVVAAVMPVQWAFGLAMLPCGAALLATNTSCMSLLQIAAPRNVVARLMGAWVAGYFLWTPVASPLLGAASDAFGARVALAGSGVLCALVVAGTTLAVTSAARRRAPASNFSA